MPLDMKFYQCHQIMCPRPPQKEVTPRMGYKALTDDIGESVRWRSSRMGEPLRESKHSSRRTSEPTMVVLGGVGGG